MRRAPTACLVAGLLLGAAARADTDVRVRIAEAVGSVRLAGEALEVAGRGAGAPALIAKARGGAVVVGSHSSRAPLRLRARDGIAVDGRWFPGGVVLLPRDGGLDVVNVVPLELYVERCAASEIYPDWPVEVLKAQAVVARTYALHERARRSGEPFDVESSVVSQRYDSRSVPSSIRRAARATHGEYVAWSGEPILAAYHSSAGGHTASAAEVWGIELPYLTPVPSPDNEAPDYFWSYEIALGDLQDALRERGFALSDTPEVSVLERTRSGRVGGVRIGGQLLSGRDLRETLGGRALRSTLFDIRLVQDTVRFLGSGAGHGVGLSQWGARELAEQGKSYRQILEYFYPASELRSLGEPEPRSARAEKAS